MRQTPSQGQLDHSNASSAWPACGPETTELELSLFGEPFRARLALPAGDVGLADVVPMARSLADRIVRWTADRARRNGLTVRCRPGCSACCRYLVSLSAPEALRLLQEVQALPPERRRQTVRAFAAAARRLLRARPPEIPSAPPALAGSGNSSALKAISEWYRGLQLDCPFLAGDLCGIYADRPIVCREQLVAAPAARLGRGPAGGAEVLQMPLSVAEALARLAADLEQTPPESVMLPVALLWAEASAERARRTWPAAELLERFDAIARALAAARLASAA